MRPVFPNYLSFSCDYGDIKFYNFKEYINPQLTHPSDNFPVCFFYSVRTNPQFPPLTHFFHMNQNINTSIYKIINEPCETKRQEL